MLATIEQKPLIGISISKADKAPRFVWGFNATQLERKLRSLTYDDTLYLGEGRRVEYVQGHDGHGYYAYFCTPWSCGGIVRLDGYQAVRLMGAWLSGVGIASKGTVRIMNNAQIDLNNILCQPRLFDAKTPRNEQTGAAGVV